MSLHPGDARGQVKSLYLLRPKWEALMLDIVVVDEASKERMRLAEKGLKMPKYLDETEHVSLCPHCAQDNWVELWHHPLEDSTGNKTLLVLLCKNCSSKGVETKRVIKYTPKQGRRR